MNQDFQINLNLNLNLKVTEILEGEDKQALRQTEGIKVHLEQKCTELKKTQEQLKKLSKNKNDVDFLQVRWFSHGLVIYDGLWWRLTWR